MSFDSWHLTKLICKVIIKSHFSTCRLPSHPLWSDSITQLDLLGQLHDSPSVRDCGTFTPQSTGLQAANCLWKKEKHLKAPRCPQRTKSTPRKPECSLMCCWAVWGPHKVDEHNQSTVGERSVGLSARGGLLNTGQRHRHRQEGETALRPNSRIHSNSRWFLAQTGTLEGVTVHVSTIGPHKIKVMRLRTLICQLIPVISELE